MSTIEPVRKQVLVSRNVEDAFTFFTAEISQWWPLKSFSVSQETARMCAVEPRQGGQLYEEDQEGRRHVWGTIRVWEPPHRLVFTWHPGRAPETAQEVEISFIDEGGKTRVSLEHRNWEVLGEKAEETRQGYVSGWETVFTRAFGNFCRREP